MKTCSTIREGHTDTHRHMDAQTHIPTYRQKRTREQVSVVGTIAYRLTILQAERSTDSAKLWFGAVFDFSNKA